MRAEAGDHIWELVLETSLQEGLGMRQSSMVSVWRLGCGRKGFGKEEQEHTAPLPSLPQDKCPAVILEKEIVEDTKHFLQK